MVTVTITYPSGDSRTYADLTQRQANSLVTFVSNLMNDPTSEVTAVHMTVG